METKKYLQPETEIHEMELGNQLLEGSTDPGFGGAKRNNFSDWDDDEATDGKATNK